MLKCSYLVEWWMCDDDDSGLVGRIMQSLHVFSSFSDYSDINMCFNFTVGPNKITLGCCSKGTRYVSKYWIDWSRLIHPECNINAISSTVVVNSIEDGGDGWDWDVILLLVFI